MSDLILSWLNDEVQLSSKVTDFEHDFANGFLFGELLSKYNQQLNFNEFSNKDLRNSKINNFKLLEPTFKTLKIKFNAQIADAIIKQQKGTVYSILYSLKMALEKVHNPADIKVFDDTGKLNTIVPLKQIRPAREKFDSMESNLFSKRLNQRNKAQKEIDLDKKLEKFSEAQVKNEQKALEKLREEQERDKQIQEERRKIELNKLQRNITFMEDWQAKGWAEWTKNMKVKNEREKRDKDFEETQNTKTKDRMVKAERIERQEVLDDITAFESNAQKFGIELEHDPEQTTKKVEPTTYASGPTTLSKLKEQTIKSENARRERDKRRRKMIVDQAKSQRDVEIKKREEILIEKLQQQSKQENEIAYEVWRALQCKEVIIENRNLRNDEYKLKKETQTTVAQYKEERLLEQIFEENQRDFDQKMFRQRELNVHQLSDARQADYRTNAHIFDFIFEIAELCFQHQQDNDTNDIDPRFWRDCSNLFTEDKPLVPKTTFRHPDATENIAKQLEPEIKESTEQLAVAELYDYLNGLGAWKPIHQFDPPKDEEDNTYIPNAPLNNFNLGQLVSNLIDMKYPQREPIVVPAEIPNYLPLKILSLGYDFSGRKTLCEFLKNKYDIQVLHINDILNEALENSNKVLDEQSQYIENGGEQAEEGQQKVEKLSDIGNEMKEYLGRGKEIPQHLYIKAIITKIKEFYPALSHEEFLEELRRIRGIPNKQNESSSHNEQNSQEIERSHHSIDEINSEAGHEGPAAGARPKYTKGWVLMGYPNNYEQLKALENALSGFIPSDEQGNSEAENRKERAELVVRAPAKNIVPRRLIRGGLDTAIILDITKEESLRRALGRRVDPTTGIMYHLEDIPPPTDEAPLIERLVSINNAENSEASLIDRLTKYDKNSQEMENWLKIFGFEEIQVNCLQKFEGIGKREDIHAEIENHIEKLLEYKALEQDRMLEAVELEAKRKIEEEEQRKIQEHEDARMVVVGSEVILEGISAVQEKRIAELTIPQHLLEVMTTFWEVVQNNYINSTKGVFAEIKKQRNFLSVRVSELQRRFLDMVQKEDDKLLLILKFQEEYNIFVEENPDMIEDNDTKEELHQRVEDLYQQIWEMIENKKEELIEERKQIMNSGYIEDEMELFATNIQKLFQAELDRYFGCLQIINDYYNALDGKDLPEVPENFIFDILPKIVDALPPIEDPEGAEPFPRIELYYKNAVKILNGEEIEDLTLAKDAKKGKAPPKKEDPKKAAAGKKGQEQPQVEEKKELTPLEKELSVTIQTEKAIMRYRLYVIKSLAINRIKEMREKAKTLYNKLDDWLTYGIKAENDAVFELTNILGEAIEGQVKVQTELQLYYVDVINSRRQLNFYTPPIIPLPPRELKQPNRFTVSQLRGLIGQVSAFTQPADIIENQTLLQFLNQRTMNTLSKDELPDDWRAKNFVEYHKMINNLDPQHKGYIPFKVLASYICLLATPLPSEEDILEYQTELYNNADENGFITREAFVNAPAFFDAHESSPHTEANSEVFTRVELIKDLLFEINGDRSKGLLNISEYINAITTFNNVGGTTGEELSEERGLYQITESPLPSPGKKKVEKSEKGKKSEREDVVRTYTNLLFD